MSAAMASGDVHMSVSQGVPPFVVATSAGQDIQILDVAVSYSENDNCVIREELEIDKSSVAELAGKKVAVPLGTAAHYGFLKQMSHFGVDVGSLDVVDMAPPDGAAAIAQGSVDMACGWGGSLRRMLEHGNILLTGAEKEELGILVFDVTSGPASWVAENSDTVSAFLKVTAEANAMWADEANQAKMLPVIAKDAGMDEDATMETIATFTFPSLEDQMGEKWLGGGAQEFMKASQMSLSKRARSTRRSTATTTRSTPVRCRPQADVSRDGSMQGRPNLCPDLCSRRAGQAGAVLQK